MYQPGDSVLEKEARSVMRARDGEPRLLPPLTLDAPYTGRRERSFVLPLAATGVAVAGVIVGAIFTSVSQATVQFDVAGRPYLDTRKRAHSLSVAANVAFGVAGLAALTGGMLLLVDYQPGGEESASTPAASEASATLVVPF